jgi:hypothetical protein
MIKAAAEVYFLEHPHETLPGDLKALLGRARDYSSRRNEIAHGIVQRATIYSDTRYGYYLFPPDYASNKLNIALLHALAVETALSPRYMYSSAEIGRFEERFCSELIPKADEILHEIVRTILLRYETRRAVRTG